ncbi:MAG: asparagine synthetase B family protein [Bacteroidales bacterium]|nr:asparagine synthetase B family protein [Bacteroidales bacterium]
MKKLLSKYKWYTNQQFSCCGFLILGDKYIRGKEIEDYFTPAGNLNQFEEKLKAANGQFAIICEIDGKVIAACDRLRTIPLFYNITNNELALSDSAHTLLNIMPEPCINNRATESILLCGYALNNTSLIEELYQVEAGEYIVIDTEPKRVQYNDFLAKPEISIQHKYPENTLVKTLDTVFASHLSALKDRMIAIPLSGGFDSRLISLMCSRYHPDNLIAFTYGTRNSPEISLAKKVANKLAINWVPVYYDEDCIKDFALSQTFESYYSYSSELNSIFFMQDYFAVLHLSDKGLIDKNTVFLPGHTGDVLSGGHLSPGQNITLDRKEISKLIFNKHFQYTRTNRSTKSDILSQIEEKIPFKALPAYRIIENWEYTERQSKMIINSASVFSFFGFEWILPLWDLRLINYFGNLAFEDKIYSNLYRKVLSENFFEEAGINFKLEFDPTPRLIKQQLLKESIKKLLPRFIVNSLVSNADHLNYKDITSQLKSEITEEYRRPPKQKNYYNAYLAQFLLSKSTQQLK